VKKADPAVKKNDAKLPVVTPVKAEPRKKTLPAGKVDGPRPASKLDENEEPSAPKRELKRPGAQ